MDLLTALIARYLSNPRFRDRDYNLLYGWLTPEIDLNQTYPLTYELSLAIHNYHFTESSLGSFILYESLRCYHLRFLPHEKQKVIADWLTLLHLK